MRTKKLLYMGCLMAASMLTFTVTTQHPYGHE